MRYELLLQAPELGAPYDAARVDSLLASRGAAAEAGGRLWKLKHGEVEVRPLVEAGRLIATELRAPMSASADLARELVLEGCVLAAEAGARLFDPQLGKVLAPADEGLVADQFLRTARYAGQYAGVPEAIDAGFAGPEPGRLKAGTKVLLGIAGFLAVLYLIGRLLG
ncbi:MAG: hypothetical protein HYZ28_10645 [Myxococcales bacterium]|nr:hypothetical protein [Myxococcales bacterium]